MGRICTRCGMGRIAFAHSVKSDADYHEYTPAAPAVPEAGRSPFLSVEEEDERDLEHSLIVLLDYRTSIEGKRHHAQKIRDRFARLRAPARDATGGGV